MKKFKEPVQIGGVLEDTKSNTTWNTTWHPGTEKRN
jgi:hypothetical protein